MVPLSTIPFLPGLLVVSCSMTWLDSTGVDHRNLFLFPHLPSCLDKPISWHQMIFLHLAVFRWPRRPDPVALVVRELVLITSTAHLWLCAVCNHLIENKFHPDCLGQYTCPHSLWGCLTRVLHHGSLASQQWFHLVLPGRNSSTNWNQCGSAGCLSASVSES